MCKETVSEKRIHAMQALRSYVYFGHYAVAMSFTRKLWTSNRIDDKAYLAIMDWLHKKQNANWKTQKRDENWTPW